MKIGDTDEDNTQYFGRHAGGDFQTLRSNVQDRDNRQGATRDVEPVAALETEGRLEEDLRRPERAGAQA